MPNRGSAVFFWVSLPYDSLKPDQSSSVKSSFSIGMRVVWTLRHSYTFSHCHSANTAVHSKKKKRTLCVFFLANICTSCANSLPRLTKL